MSFAISLFKTYPLQTVSAFASFFLAGLMEGVGVTSVLPLLTLLNPAQTEVTGEINTIARRVFGSLGLELNITTILLAIVTLICTKAIVTFLAMIKVGQTTSRIGNDLRMRYIQALLKAKWQYFRTLPVGKSANAVSTEATRAATAYLNFGKAAADSIQVVIYLLLAALISWKITLCALLAGALIGFLLKPLIAMSRRSGAEQTAMFSGMSAHIADALAGVKSLKAMGAEDFFFREIHKKSNRLADALRDEFISGQALSIAREPIIAVILALGMYVSVTKFHVPLPVLLVLSVMFFRVVLKVTAIQASYQRVATQESAYWAVLEAIRDAEAAAEKSMQPNSNKPQLGRSLRMENVTFSYDQDAIKDTTVKFCPQPALRSIDMIIPARTLTVIVGPSGSGKTTLLDLLCGLHQPQEGQILIDDQPLQEIGLRAWRRCIGYVPQDGILFHDSILQNVTLGDESIGEETVAKALRESGAFSFISELPRGIHTIVGERGSRLSGGQRQRLHIARALVKKPDILLLDEPTSAMDSKAEQHFMSSVKLIARNITVVAITHSASVMKYSDHSFLIENGRLQKHIPSDGMSENRGQYS